MKVRLLTRVGLLSGTFDPVHAGHISFALEAVRQAELDVVYFLPERTPRRKEGVTHYAHRVAMLKLALRPYQKLKLLELPDKQFSVARTLPRLKERFKRDSLFQLIGSDTVELLVSQNAAQEWPGFDTYLDTVTLIVGVRTGVDKAHVRAKLDQLQPEGFIATDHAAEISSSTIRLAVSRGKVPKELLHSIRGYVKQHWLYASMDGVDANNSL